MSSHRLNSLTVLAVGLGQSLVTYADEPTQVTDTITATANTTVGISPIVDTGYIFQFLLALGLVIGGIFVLMHLLRKLNHLPGKGSSSIRVIGGVPLGAREKLVLVQVGETQLLLGMAPGQLRTLHVFDEPVVSPDDANNSAGFAAVLGVLTAKGKQP